MLEGSIAEKIVGEKRLSVHLISFGRARVAVCHVDDRVTYDDVW